MRVVFPIAYKSNPKCMEMTLVSNRYKGPLTVDQVLGGGVNCLM